MGNLARRLDRIAARIGASEREHHGRSRSRRSYERLYRELEKHRRRIDGLEPLPDPEYTQEDYQDDLDTLAHTIPAYCEELGWQTDEAKAFLNEWERTVRDRLERKEATHE